MKLKAVIIGLVFLLGLYFICVQDKIKEGFNNKDDLHYRCPNVLIQKGTRFHLYNSSLANVPGVNPISFNHLDEYRQFAEWQRSQGIRCPILYVQESYDTQGNPVYTARPSPTDPQGGLPVHGLPIPPGGPPGSSEPITKLFDAGRDDPPYNKNSYPSYDQQDQYIGLNTPLDQMFHDTGSKVSPNPMDANWGGRAYTQELVDEGYYKDDEVSMKIV